MKQRLKNSRFFDKKFLPLKFIRETLAIDDVKGKVDKEIIHTSLSKVPLKILFQDNENYYKEYKNK